MVANCGRGALRSYSHMTDYIKKNVFLDKCYQFSSRGAGVGLLVDLSEELLDRNPWFIVLRRTLITLVTPDL